MTNPTPTTERALACLAQSFALLPSQLAPFKAVALQLQAQGQPVSPGAILSTIQRAQARPVLPGEALPPAPLCHGSLAPVLPVLA
jgi:hypothetical protein